MMLTSGLGGVGVVGRDGCRWFGVGEGSADRAVLYGAAGKVGGWLANLCAACCIEFFFFAGTSTCHDIQRD